MASLSGFVLVTRPLPGSQGLLEKRCQALPQPEAGDSSGLATAPHTHTPPPPSPGTWAGQPWAQETASLGLQESLAPCPRNLPPPQSPVPLTSTVPLIATQLLEDSTLRPIPPHLAQASELEASVGK